MADRRIAARLRRSVARSTFRGLSRLLHHWPLLKGETWWSSRRWIGRIAKAGGPLYTIPMRSGHTIEVDTSDWNGLTVGLFGATELQLTRLCAGLLEPGDVFLDIGANYGAVGMNCVNAVGPKGEVHFVEPQPELAEKIRSAVHYDTRAFVHSLALGDREGEAMMRRDASHTGGASLLLGRSGSGEEIRVLVRDAGAFLAEVVNGRACAAKVDVEGAEAIVVPALLAMENLRFIVFEHNQGSPEVVYSKVSSAGFDVLGLPQRWLAPTPELVTSPAQMAQYLNFLAVRSGSGGTAN